jgi:nitroreductase/Pyruvate/2-oxoacid:ferredoxin oxidoreductase delta subunit
MSLFVVDSARCKGDGICVAECPTRIIELTLEHGTPSVPTESEEFCRNCGHCVAVCPQGAVSLATMAPDQLLRVRPEWSLGREQVTHFLRARRSIRTFTPKLVDHGVLAGLIDVARFAPTASNRQPVRWVVVEEGDAVRRLAGLVVGWMRAGLPTQTPAVRKSNERFIALWDSGRDVICRGAPHLIVACGPEALPVSATDCVIALTYLELAAPSFDLGACWAGFFTAAARQWTPLKEALALPDGHIVCGAMMIGYPRYRYYRLPLRNEAHITWQGSNR